MMRGNHMMWGNHMGGWRHHHMGGW
jgi:hypothetical protein